MILDQLARWKEYFAGRDAFRAGFEFLEKLDRAKPDGTYPIDGDRVYCSVQTYDTKSRADYRFEAHRTYADIQILLDGTESILWTPSAGLTVLQPYQPDIEFYAAVPAPTDVALVPGLFCVFFPQDAHAPCLTHDHECKVRKAVVKVKVAS